MTTREKEKLEQLQRDLNDLNVKLDRLPDELIKRLDDRYLQKDDAPKQFITRREGKAANWVIGLSLTLITFVFSAIEFMRGR